MIPFVQSTRKKNKIYVLEVIKSTKKTENKVEIH